VQTFYWQLYEISGLGQGETPVISKVPNQPADYNNVSPIYGTDDRIIFTSDRPRNGERHLYPQLDEYEEAPTVSGIWSLDPATGDLRLLNHAPSGDFTPILDSFGRIVFTQWDHLQRDQQADADAEDPSEPYGTFNYADESAAAAILDDRSEVFPEPRAGREDLLAGTNLVGHSFNHFLPWQMHEDGAEGEILNHLGRHELHSYIPAAIEGDDNIIEYYGQYSRNNPNPILNLLQIRESPALPGVYYGTDAPEFGTHAAGQIISLSAAPHISADDVQVTYITHRATASTDETPSADHSGLYRDPLPLSDGAVAVVHTAETREDENEGSRAAPASLYDFRIKLLAQGAGGVWSAGSLLTPGISKNVSWWDPDVLVSYNGPLWELQPVEVRARTRPTRLTATLPAPEQAVFAQAGVDPAQFQAYLRQHNLAVIASRNVTTRDDLDRQQPFNLRVAGDGAQTIGAAGAIYEVAHLQIFQAEQLRGLTFGGSEPRPGRRVLAQALHDGAALQHNPANAGGPAGSVAIAPDGSAAAFVPAQRALTWQITDAGGEGVVRERNWLSFQPGEIRVCTSCHGPSTLDQAGNSPPANQPQALLTLLQAWKAEHGGDATPSPTSTPTPTATPTPTTPPAAADPPELDGCNLFPADNIWNAPVDTLPVDPNSAAYVGAIGATEYVHADFGSGLWEGGPIGIPFVTVPGVQPRVDLTFEYDDESDPGPYPIPPDAPIEGGPGADGDRHILVLDRDNCVLYEVFAAYPQEDGSWQAGSGAIFDLNSHALRPDTWTSADAAGLPILPGLVRYDEAASGEIRHAIRFTAPDTRRAYVWPGRHYASDLTDAQYPPLGQRFRLKADFDISGFSPIVQVILQAMKKYGIILADNGSAWYISGAPDERWNNDVLHEMHQIPGNAFEAVDSSSLMIHPDSGQAQINGASTPTPTLIPTVQPGLNGVYLPVVEK
jgi:hypothetical protein